MVGVLEQSEWGEGRCGVGEGAGASEAMRRTSAFIGGKPAEPLEPRSNITQPSAPRRVVDGGEPRKPVRHAGAQSPLQTCSPGDSWVRLGEHSDDVYF